MKHIRKYFIGVVLAMILGLGSAHADDSLRAEVGRPMVAAQELLKVKKYKEALAKVRDAEAIANRTTYENFVIDRMRAVAAAGAGDTETAVRSFESVIASGRLSPDESYKTIEAVAGTYYRGGNYANASNWARRYFKEGGTSQQMRSILIQALYLSADYAGSAKELAADIALAERSGRLPSEEYLQLLGNCQLKLKDQVGYISTLERLVSSFPKRDYWVDLIQRVETRPGFSDRLALDVFRIKYATGIFSSPNDYIEASQLSMQGGFPEEARKVIEQGYARGILGIGPDAARHSRLREMATKSANEDAKVLMQTEISALAAKDGGGLVNSGFNYVILGQTDKGLSLMEQGIKRGNLKRPDDALLHLAIAYFYAGQKDKARQAFKDVLGTDGTSDLSKLWTLLSKNHSS